MVTEQSSVAVRYAGDPKVHMLTFTIDMNKPASKATDRIGTAFRSWTDLYEELGPFASFPDLVIYLARIYGEDPSLHGVEFDIQTEEVLRWKDRHNFEYTFKGHFGRVYRIDPERYV